MFSPEAIQLITKDHSYSNKIHETDNMIHRHKFDSRFLHEGKSENNTSKSYIMVFKRNSYYSAITKRGILI